MKQRLDYNLNWSEYFRLDATSPSGLVRFKDYSGKNVQKYNVGTRIYRDNGKPDSWRVKLKRKDYYVHRVIWVWTYGSINSDLVIDHLDGDPFNNRIDNLRLKAQKGNNRNHQKQRNNKTGTTGVKLSKVNGEYRYYVATWYELNGVFKVKYFSIVKLGEETAKALAIAYREDQISRLILEGADYTDRHGI